MTITFHCKLLTPLFLTGAEKNVPEIRPSSIKGALRWWWRAMNANLPLEELAKAEAALFGSVDKKSPLVVRTSHPPIQNLYQETKTAEESIAKQGNDVGRYLFFSQRMGDNLHNRAFPIGQTFDVIFSAPDEITLKKAVSAFWLLTHFGGLGTRSRRGGGNFEIVKTSDSAGLLSIMDLAFGGQAEQPLATYLKENFEVVKAFLQEKGESAGHHEYSNLMGAEVLWAQNGGDLFSIGKELKDFRFEHAGKSNLVAKAAFGLPLSSKNPQVKNSDEWEVIVDGSDSDRRASPVILREIKYLGKKYALILFLEGKPLNTTVSLRKTTERKAKGTAESYPVDNVLVKAFARKLKHDYSFLSL